MTAPLRYLLITVKVVALEEVSLVIHKILSLFDNTLTVDNKHYLLNRDNLTQPIQIRLSLEKKTFLIFFSIFKILKICRKKMTLTADVFPDILAPKNMVR